MLRSHRFGTAISICNCVQLGTKYGESGGEAILFRQNALSMCYVTVCIACHY